MGGGSGEGARGKGRKNLTGGKGNGRVLLMHDFFVAVLRLMMTGSCEHDGDRFHGEVLRCPIFILHLSKASLSR